MSHITDPDLSEDEIRLAAQLDNWFDAHREEFVQDLLQWVAHPSIADEKLAQPGKPFGAAVDEVFHHVLARAQALGFSTENHDGYAISIYADDREGVPEIGLVSHLDVVPPGDNWQYAPFEPFEKEGFVIGRGASDNKGPALVDLYLLRAFRYLGITLSHKLRIIYGGAEEIGMNDIRYLAQHGTLPRFSLITDGGFPVNYAQKGGLNLALHIPAGPLLTGLRAGVAENAVPSSAALRFPVAQRAQVSAALATLGEAQRAVLTLEEAEGGLRLVAQGKSGHAAFPEGTQNAIPLLLDALLAAGLLDDPADLRAAQLVSKLLADPWGEGAGIAAEDAATGKLTLNGGLAIPAEVGFELWLDIRYPLAADSAALQASLRTAVEATGGSLRVLRDDAPMHIDKNSPLVQQLLHTYDAVAQTRSEPFSMGGATHARVLPNSITFGPGFSRHAGGTFKGQATDLRPDFIRAGHGSPHGPDEFVVLDNLKRGFGVYGITLPRLDRWLQDGLAGDV